MNINLEYYKIFYHVARCQSITAAARELCISQPAVSQAIRQLESAAGTQLFVRMPKGVALTAEGTLLYSYVASGYEQMKLGEHKLHEMLNLEHGEVRIGASDMTLQFYLLPYLQQYHQRYPQIKVTVTNAPTPQTIEHLHAGRIDFGVVSTPFDYDKRLTVTNARDIEDIFVAGSKFWKYKNQMLHYKQLEKLPIICLENKTSTRKFIDLFLESNKVVLEPEFELATSDMIVQFALRNLGVGCVMADFARKYIESGDLFTLQFDKQIPKRKICVINDDKLPMSVAARRLMELLRDEKE